MEEYLGEVKIFAGDYAPENYMFCYGQELQITEHQALYGLIGTSFGGNGTTSFNLPDFRGRVPLGVGTGRGLTTRIIGYPVGEKEKTIFTPEMPQHTHEAQVSPPTYSCEANQRCYKGFGSGNSDPKKRYPGPAPSTEPLYYHSADAKMGAMDAELLLSGEYSVKVDYTGGMDAIELYQPSSCLNFIICINGLWPQRS